jgi:hypothetical protein
MGTGRHLRPTQETRVVNLIMDAAKLDEGPAWQARKVAESEENT